MSPASLRRFVKGADAGEVRQGQVRPRHEPTHHERGGAGLSPASKPGKRRRPRDAAATQERIFDAAIDEFAEHGYSGARIDAIARRADANIRMIYHYFTSKELLYVKVLEKVFEAIRHDEQDLDLLKFDPMTAIVRLFDFTYDNFSGNPRYVRLLTGENLLGGRHLKVSNKVSAISSPLLDAIDSILRRGERENVFRKDIDPLQLYVTMVALSYFHISNCPTLSHLFSLDLSTQEWRAARQRHAHDMLISYLRLEAAGKGSSLSIAGSRQP